jgi:hypothetical protein
MVVSAWSVGSMELGMMQMNQYVAGAWSDLRVCVVRPGVVRMNMPVVLWGSKLMKDYGG